MDRAPRHSQPRRRRPRGSQGPGPSRKKRTTERQRAEAAAAAAAAAAQKLVAGACGIGTCAESRLAKQSLVQALGLSEYDERHWTKIKRDVKEFREELRALYDAAPGKAQLKERDCAYRIHARRGDHGVARSLGKTVANSSYACLVRSILAKDSRAKICVFSEGVKESFGELARLPVEFVLDGDPFETFHNFVTAEHLFPGHSLLSGAAAVLATQAQIHLVPHEPSLSRPLRKSTLQRGFNVRPDDPFRQ